MKVEESKASEFGWHIPLLLMLSALTANDAGAQEQAADTREAVELDVIEVTGSRIKRSELEGPQPLIIIDQQELAERGYTTVYEALSDLTINNGWKAETTEGPAFTPDVQTINLRGFGVGTTLTLINGRRLTNYPAPYQADTTVFSFGSIPVAAIERIEILASGASAIYGSDAVAGVVNIILRNDVNETTINALWGTPTESKSTRDDIRLQLVTGRMFDRGGFTFTAEYRHRDAILGKHYKHFDDQQEDYPYGQGIYARSIMVNDWFRNLFGVPFYYRDPADLTGMDGETACGLSGGGLVYAHRPPFHGNFCTDLDSGVPGIVFQNQHESLSLYFNGHLEIGDSGTELFSELLFYDAESSPDNDAALVLFSDVLDLTQPDSIGFGFYDWYLAQRSFNEKELGMDLTRRHKDRAYTIVGGIRGTFWDWHEYELSINYSNYSYKSTRPHWKWREAIDNFLGTWLGRGFTGQDWWSGGTLGENLPFGIGDPNNLYAPPNQAVYDAIGISSYDNETEDFYIQYIMSGDLRTMSAGPLSYALVAEYEDQDLTYKPDDLLRQLPPTTDAVGNPVTGLSGSGWAGLTGYNARGDRQRWSLGGELRIPLHETLILNAAARYDDYDSTSTSYSGTTPSASLEWRPVSGLLVRAGYTESFRAPDMALVFLQTGAYTGGYDYTQCYEQYVFLNGTDEGFDISGCDSTWQFVQRSGPQEFGGKPLDAETGDSYWFGFSWDVTDALNITADYTDMRLEQRVQSQSANGLLEDEWACYNGDEPSTTPCEQISKQIIRGTDPITGVSFIEDFYVTAINQFEEEGSFIDVRVTYDLDTKFGNWRFQGDYNKVLDHTLKLTPDSEEIDLKNDPIVGGWDFKSSFTGSLTWTYKNFSTTLTGIYRGPTAIYSCTTAINGCVGNDTGEDYYATENWWVDSYTTWNLTAAYNWTDAFMSRLRITNLFDEGPPWDDTFKFFHQPWYNYFVYPGAGIGRYAALELEYRF